MFDGHLYGVKISHSQRDEGEMVSEGQKVGKGEGRIDSRNTPTEQTGMGGS